MRRSVGTGWAAGGCAALARSPHDQPVGGPLTDDPARAEELLRLASLTYGDDDPGRHHQGAALLAAHPRLARTSIHTAACVGDAPHAAALLAADPSLANTQGGPFNWEPLLYLTYSRLPATDPYDALATARVLLDAGADPNAGYLWEGLVPPFTALTGVFGSGEGSQPPHAQWRGLARLLLAAGADPNDGQTIYNWGLGSLNGDDASVLELLLEFGFGTGDGGPWRRLLGERQASPAEVMAEELAHAATSGLPRRTCLLLAHGADPDSRGGHPAFGGRTAYENAVSHGHAEVAALLAAAGADTTSVDSLTVFLGNVLAGDRVAVTRALALDATLIEQALRREPDSLNFAAEQGRTEGVRLLVELGWDVNARYRTTALHEAALRGDRALVDVLLALGADPRIHDTAYDSPPAGWAAHSGHTELAAYLDAVVGESSSASGAPR